MTDVRRRRPGTGLPPFQHLLDLYCADVLRFLTRRVGPLAADDCFQETWLAALRAYPSLRDAENLRGWLLTIARNKATDAERAAARRPLVVETLPETAGPERELDDGELMGAVAGLPGKQRRAVELRFVEDRDYPGIAAAMSTSEAAARRNVHEGIKKLRRHRP
ncbi:MAG: sigma-70 family RNA polymerase sigma factor [Candidatus Dormibacteraeota bacterium]|nr:sigma-70 family RNA polymerase sigma factor [Candidatus Dormibacteraeota bacterium]